MTRLMLFAGMAVLAFGSTSAADEPRATAEAKKETTKATLLITGLHCPACTATVESSLRNIKGIRLIKVDWKTKNARVEFDETVLSTQQVARKIEATPHMMGGNMHYGGWLALKVPELKDDATAKQVKEVLSKVAGVKQVAAYPAQHSVGIAFDAKGNLTSAQVIDLLAKAGIKAGNL